MTTKTSLFGDFDDSVQIKRRKADGQFNLWRKVLLHEENPENNWVAWEAFGVFSNRGQAEAAREEYRKQVKPKKKT